MKVLNHRRSIMRIVCLTLLAFVIFIPNITEAATVTIGQGKRVTYSVSADGGTVTVSLTGAYNAVLRGKPSWVSVSGKTITISKNTATSSRSGDVVFQNGNSGPTYTLRVSQAAAKPKTVTVKFNNNGGYGNVPSKTYTVGKTYASLPAGSTPPTGKVFDGWYTAASGGIKITASSTVSASYTTLYAHYKAKTFTVTFKDGSTTVSTKTVTYGSTYGTLPTRTKTGYNAADWYTATSGGTKITASTKVTITANQTLYARWNSPKTYTVTFKDGTTTVSTKTVTYGSTYGTLPTRTKTGYNNADWYTATSGGTKITASAKVTITANQTLYARWTGKTISVKFNNNGGYGNVPNQSYVVGNKYGSLPAGSTPPNGGYKFDGWYTAASGGTKVTNTTIVNYSWTTLYAHYSPKTFTITFKDGSTTVSTKTVTYGSTYGALPTRTKTGYNNATWYTATSGGSQITASTKVTITANQTLYARWTGKTISVKFDNNGGYGNVPNQSYVVGNKYGSLPAGSTPPNGGYKFDGWYSAKSGGTKVTTTTIVNYSWTTLYAHYVSKSITVTFKDGSTTVDTKAVTSGSTYGALPAPVKGDYIFDGWYTAASGGAKVTDSTIITTTSNHTLYAHWTKGKKVLIINFDPDITTSAGSKVKQHSLRSNWSDPHDLANKFVSAMKDVSYGNVNYSIVQTIDVNALPKSESGKGYTAKDYYDTLTKALNAYPDGSYWNYTGWESFGRFGYEKYFTDYDVINKINKGEIDEVWFFTGPMVGVNLSESIMVGKDAFYMNGSPIVKSGVRNFAVYGFSYERGLGEMLEDAGHRMEWTMSRVYSGVSRSNWINPGFDIKEDNYIKYVNGKKTYKQYSELNDWEKFWAHDLVTDGKIVAGVGSVHCGPNARGQYDWNNNGNGTWERNTPKSVKSYCDDWLNYPNLTGSTIMVSSSAWGGTLEGHHKWWFKRIPHASGSSNGKYNNWWQYFLFEDLK